jgi:glutamine synthetase
VPDLATLRRSPWASVPRYLAVHDCVELSGELCAFAPRSVLKNVLAAMPPWACPRSWRRRSSST